MNSTASLLRVFCMSAALLSMGASVDAAASAKSSSFAYTGRKPVLLSKKAVAPLGAMTKGHHAQNRVELPNLSASELDYIQQKDKIDGQKRLRIGIGRALSQPILISATSAPVAEWTIGTNGVRLWTVHLTSHGAVGLRVHLESLKLDPRVTVVTYNPFSPDATIAPVPCEKPDPEVGIWTPTVFGEDAVVELQAPTSVDIASIRLSVTGVSHQYRGLNPIPKAAADVCEHDITCQSAWRSSGSGVARIDFTDRAGDGFACSGCLIQSHGPGATPNYFLTAHHCINNSGLASTIESTWFWYDTQCDNPNSDNGGTLVGGGADLLATSSSSDFALVQLRDDPPNGAAPQDWTTNLLGQGEAVTGIHYPYPDPEKISFGNETDFDSGFWYLQWNYGVTEEGSSGSPLFNSAHQIVGQLYGGSSACDNLQGIDQYGRFDKTYAQIRQWIDSFPFVRLGGTYSGLFSDSGTPANQSSGFITLTLRKQGSYSGTLRLAGKRYSFHGVFDTSGNANNQIPAASGTLSLDMSIDPTSGAESISGHVSNGSWTSDLLAKRPAFNARTNPAPFAQRYTVMLPGGNSSDAPRGFGFMSLTVDQSGHAKMIGSAGDGTRFSQSTVVFPDDTLPLFANLYHGNGVIDGWLSFSGDFNTLGGSTTWLKDPVPASKRYPLGFSLFPDAQGEMYTVPSSGAQVVPITDGSVSFAGGNLASDFSNDVTISSNNHVVNDSPNHLTLSFAPGTGKFNGTVVPPEGGRGIGYHGIVLQLSGAGYGYFLGKSESGSVQLSPR